jgi:hypothetical protein
MMYGAMPTLTSLRTVFQINKVSRVMALDMLAGP